MTRTQSRYWIGVDGEGVGRNPHRYALLAWCTSEGRGAFIEDPDGISSYAALNFLLDMPTDGRACGYYLGYDWTMILKDLPDKSVYRLLRPELRVLPRDEGGGFSHVRWKGFHLHYLSGMMRIKHPKSKRAVTVWDLGKFYQSTFVESLQNWKILPQHKIDAIKAMKDQRSEFASVTKEVRDYCLSECKSLARLAESLEEAHESIGLRPRSWHGPGSTASVALQAMSIQDKRGECPPEVADAASRAFFGGRFEHSCIGRKSDCYGRDIVSAYPFQAYNLPCLEHGTWEYAHRFKEIEQCRTALINWRLTDIGDLPWAPLPCRLQNGTIVYPRGGCTGWSWLPEWNKACEHFGKGLYFLGAWVLKSDCDCQPFKRVLEWFRERVALGKSAKGKVLKLLLNSIYGKLAQTVGAPKYASRVWAGLITSGTRAMLLDTTMRHDDPAQVYALATDGIYSGQRDLELSVPLAPDLLGSWETEHHGDMVFVRPGIYWSENDDTLRARGLGRKKLGEQRTKVLEAIEQGLVRADIGTTTVFGAAKACVYNPNDIRRSKLYGEWHDIPARINLTPLPKRNPDWSLRMLNGVDSMPYTKGVRSVDSKNLQAIEDIFWGSKD